jgi:hypothetical protein
VAPAANWREVEIATAPPPRAARLPHLAADAIRPTRFNKKGDSRNQ